MPIDERRLRRLDLNLLVAFVVLMRERHVSRAAARLFLGQPAMSAALARLREALEDDLFVRVGRNLEPTARARELAEPIERALESLEGALHARGAFDPGTHEGVFRLGLTDNHEVTLVPALVERMTRTAPHTRLVVRAADHVSIASLLDAGEIDATVSVLEKHPAWHQREPLYAQGYACLFSPERTGLKKALDLDAYCRRRHVLVSFRGDLEGVADAALARLGRKREVAFSVPRFASVPFVLKQADVIATLPEPIARCLAQHHGLRTCALPFALPPRTVSLLWRKRDDTDPGQRWFRDLVKAVALDAAAPGAGPKAPRPASPRRPRARR